MSGPRGSNGSDVNKGDADLCYEAASLSSSDSFKFVVREHSNITVIMEGEDGEDKELNLQDDSPPSEACVENADFQSLQIGALPSYVVAKNAVETKVLNNDERPKLKSTELNWRFLENEQFLDRQHETRRLEEAFRRRLRPNSQPELILLSGSSGTGKTVLARKLRQPVEAKDGFFIMGKFDQLKRSEPYAPIVAAVSEFVKLVLEREEDIVKKIRHRILESVGGDVGILTVMIPALEEVVGQQDFAMLKGSDAQDRLKTIFRKFVHAACVSTFPLVLVMDDLQWADLGSLELLETIASDPSNHGLVVVGVCRSNEVPLSHDFALILRRLEDEKNTTITNIEVKGLTFEATNLLVSSILQTSQEMCRSVSQTLHRKTDGNVLFVVELLQALNETGVLLVPDSERAQWLWDDDTWKDNFEDASEIVDILVRRIERLPHDCWLLLSTSAFLGAGIDEFLLSKLIDDTIDNALTRCASEGVIVEERSQGGYRFSHDRIQQASYYLIPEGERPMSHLSIGRELCKALSPFELDGYIFLVVDQMLRGVAHVTEEEEKVDLASLCLQAGEKSILSSDFQTALKYIELGASLLDLQRSWVREYDLTLNLHNAIAEAFCCVGAFDRAEAAAESIILNARCIDDKLRGYTSLIYGLAAQMRLNDAIEVGLEALRGLGEKIPSKPGFVNILSDAIKVKMMLNRYKTDSAIMSLPDINDQRKISAIGILSLLAGTCYLSRPKLYPILALRMMQISLKYGLSALSCNALSRYGVICIAMGDLDSGYRFGKLSLSCLKRYGSVKAEWIPRVHVVHFGGIAHWKEPIRSTFVGLEEAYRVGKEGGDTAFAFLAISVLCQYAILSGEALVAYEPRLRSLIAEMSSYKQILTTELTLLALEVALVMMGKADDPFVQNGAVMHLGTGSPKLTEVTNSDKLNYDGYVCQAVCYRMMIAYHQGDLVTALEMAEKSKKVAKLLPGVAYIRFQAFYEGMSALAAVGERRKLSKFPRRNLLARGRKRLKMLQKYAKHCPENCQHLALMLEAEFAVLDGKLADAMSKYSEAEGLAGKAGFLDVQALACERSAYLVHNESERARVLGRSIVLYKKWGALSKADRIEAMLQSSQLFLQLR
jgi:predicted ATPase